MSPSQLELRPLRMVVAAYLLAPLALVIGAVGWSSPHLTRPVVRTELASMLGPLAIVLAVIAGACLIGELIFITPILVGFSRYRWRWLNGWSGCAIGAMTAMALSMSLPGGLPTNGQQVSEIAIAANGALTVHSTWNDFLRGQATAGLCGLIVAVVFRLVAVRRVSTSSG